jgi:divalent metal cation (Fe/Co/Zn/Cd) transporter
MLLKSYYYLLFRIYSYYEGRPNEKNIILFSVTAVSTVVGFAFLFTIYLFLDYLDVLPMLPNKYYVIGVMILLGVFNYILFVRQKKFLEYGFKKDVNGGLLIVAYIVLIAAIFITVANLNRAKLNKQRLANPVKTEQLQKQKDDKPKSLEGRIRKWFEEAF